MVLENHGIFFLILLARKSIQNACDLLKGDFFFREVEAAKEKPSSGQATFLYAQIRCLGLSCAYLCKRSQITSG